MITTRTLLIAMLAWLTCSTASAAEPQPLADGVHLFHGQAQPGIQPDGNSLLFAGADGWVVFDSGRHAAHTDRLIAFARESGQPIVAIINSHWHLDHAAGNRRILNAYPDAKIHASAAIDDALKGFLANYAAQLRDHIPKVKDEIEKARFEAELAAIADEAALRPHRVLTGCGTHAIGGRSFHVCVEENAVTGADVWLQDIESGVLAAGDLVTLPAPFMDTACLEGWRESLGNLGTRSFEKLVPGHGRAMTFNDLQQYSTSFNALLECAADDEPADACKQQWLANVEDLMAPGDVKYTNDLLDYYIANILRNKDGKQAALCGTGERGERSEP